MDLTFPKINKLVLPSQFANDDVRFSDDFAEYFIEKFSKPNGVVFDPFVGFGTTLFAAEKLGRKPLGVEFLLCRAEYIKEHLQNKESVICGSSLEIEKLNLPEIDFCLTSPPYMQKTNHPEYPFAGYEITGQTYNDYLCDIAKIYKQIKKIMKANSYAVIEVSNLLIDGNFTPLADDIEKSVSDILTFKEKIKINWNSTYGFGQDYSFALVFQKED